MKYTLQSVFNKAVRGLAKQGFERATHDTGSCAYISYGGWRCAIGHLMTESKARMAYGTYLNAHNRLAPKVREILDSYIVVGWSQGDTLQACHDDAYDSSEVVANLIGFAEVNDLKLPKELK